jgi:hypothetical protein
VEGIQVCSNEGDSPNSRGDNSKRVKIHGKILKIFFSRTSRTNSIKLHAHYPWVKGIQICSNNLGPGSLQRGDNHKNVKMGWGHGKIFFSRTTGLILTRLGTNHPWVKGTIQIYSNKGQFFFKGEIIMKM